MAKPAYSLLYAIFITLGLLALVLFNRMLSSDEASPAAQASMQRNEATAREAREVAADTSDKAAAAERAEPAEPAAEKPDATTARPANAEAVVTADKGEERK